MKDLFLIGLGAVLLATMIWITTELHSQKQTNVSMITCYAKAEDGQNIVRISFANGISKSGCLKNFKELRDKGKIPDNCKTVCSDSPETVQIYYFKD